MQVLTIFSKLLPVILLILLGSLLKRKGIISSGGTDLIKNLIVKVGLPSIFFLSFLRTKLDFSFIYIVAGMFILNILLLFFGKAAGRINRRNGYTPFLFTGFEYGMFAIGVFGAAYGESSIGPIAVVDLGHELFIWFVYVTVLMTASQKRNSIKKTIYSFATSPIILSILLGILGNILGLDKIIETNDILSGVKTTIAMLGNLTAPLILITIGAGIHFSRKGLKFSLKVLAVRIPVVLILYAALSPIFLRGLGLPFAYAAGLYTLLIAPPPFIIPLFIPEGDEIQRAEITSVLTLYTLASLVLFILFFAVHPVL